MKHGTALKLKEHPVDESVASAIPAPWLVSGSLIAVQFLFGVNYTVSKLLLNTFPPLLWSSFRCTITGIVLALVAWGLRRRSPTVTRKFLLQVTGLSLLAVVFNQGFFLIGLKYTTPSNSALLNTLIPIFTLVLVTYLGHEKLSRRQIVGFGCALLGVAYLIGIEKFTLSNQTAVGDLLTIANCLSYACFLAFGKKFISRFDPLWTTAWLFLVGGIILTLISSPEWMQFHLPPVNPPLVGCVLFNIVGATLLTYLLNNWALANAPASKVALFVYIQPVVAALLSVLFLNERLTARTLVSGAFIFVGVFLALYNAQKISFIKTTVKTK